MRSYPIDAYQIGIVCALPEELKAVRTILDEEHEPLGSKNAKDDNSYVLGRVGKHHVVAAGLPRGVYGKTSAASVGRDMLRTLTHLRFGLLVGVGGGIPNNQANRDIRLGDVVVGQPGARDGGVVQYDRGALLPSGQFEPRGILNKPPYTLLTTLTKLQSSLQGSSIPQYLKDVEQKHPSLKSKGYCYQGAHQD